MISLSSACPKSTDSCDGWWDGWSENRPGRTALVATPRRKSSRLPTTTWRHCRTSSVSRRDSWFERLGFPWALMCLAEWVHLQAYLQVHAWHVCLCVHAFVYVYACVYAFVCCSLCVCLFVNLCWSFGLYVDNIWNLEQHRFNTSHAHTPFWLMATPFVQSFPGSERVKHLQGNDVFTMADMYKGYCSASVCQHARANCAYLFEMACESHVPCASPACDCLMMKSVRNESASLINTKQQWVRLIETASFAGRSANHVCGWFTLAAWLNFFLQRRLYRSLSSAAFGTFGLWRHTLFRNEERTMYQQRTLFFRTDAHCRL